MLFPKIFKLIGKNSDNTVFNRVISKLNQLLFYLWIIFQVILVRFRKKYVDHFFSC